MLRMSCASRTQLHKDLGSGGLSSRGWQVWFPQRPLHGLQVGNVLLCPLPQHRTALLSLSLYKDTSPTGRSSPLLSLNFNHLFKGSISKCRHHWGWGFNMNGGGAHESVPTVNLPPPPSPYTHTHTYVISFLINVSWEVLGIELRNPPASDRLQSSWRER